MAELLILRHGEPTLRGVFLGSLDPGLTELGRIQAASILVGPEFTIYSSPLRRARETAQILGRPFEMIDHLREIDYGPWEGLSWTEIESRFPAEAERKMKDWLGYTVPGAESWADFRRRVTGTLDEIRTPALVIAHLGVNSVLRESITGQPAIEFQQDYCEIVKLIT